MRRALVTDAAGDPAASTRNVAVDNRPRCRPVPRARHSLRQGHVQARLSRPAGPVAERAFVTLLFTDLVESTRHLHEMGDRAWSQLLCQHREVIRAVLADNGGKEVDTTGDGFFATFAAPTQAIVAAGLVRQRLGKLGLRVRAGIHTGECEIIAGEPMGIAVHTAARTMTEAGPGDILLTGVVRDLVAGSGIALRDWGDHAL